MKKQKKKTLKEIILTDELVFSDKPYYGLHTNKDFVELTLTPEGKHKHLLTTPTNRNLLTTLTRYTPNKTNCVR